MSLLLALLAESTQPVDLNASLTRFQTERQEVLSAIQAVPKKHGKREWPPELKAKGEAGAKAVTSIWYLCQVKAALSFANLPENVDSVVEAAIGGCLNWKDEARGWLALNFYVQETALTGAELDTMISSIEARHKQQLTSIVMTRRLAATRDKQDKSQ